MRTVLMGRPIRTRFSILRHFELHLLGSVATLEWRETKSDEKLKFHASVATEFFLSLIKFGQCIRDLPRKPPRQRAPVSPEQRPQYATPDPQVPASRTAPWYTAGAQGNAYASYEGRPQPKQNYAAGPRRLHGTRQACTRC